MSKMDPLVLVTFSATAILAAVGPSPSPNSISILGLLVMLQVYLRIFSQKFCRLAATRAALAIGIAISYASTASNTLQSSTLSVVILVAVSALGLAIPILVVWFDAHYIGKNCWFSWFQLTAFPAFCASVWGIVSLLSPVGWLFVWSPMTGLGPYAWVSLYLGTRGDRFFCDLRYMSFHSDLDNAERASIVNLPDLVLFRIYVPTTSRCQYYYHFLCNFTA